VLQAIDSTYSGDVRPQTNQAEQHVVSALVGQNIDGYRAQINGVGMGALRQCDY
jgi:hypothetical protein